MRETMFRVKVTGMRQVTAEFASASDKIGRIVSSEMEGMARDWVAASQRDAPLDQGQLKRLISFFVKGPYAVEIVSQSMYSPFMEFGTKSRYRPIPGTEAVAAQFRGIKSGSFQDMVRNIVRWVRRKGITGTYSVKTRRRTGNKVNQFAEDYAAAWPIIISILKYGVKPHPYFFEQGDRLWPQMIRRIGQRLERETKVKVILPGNINRPNITTI
jgi:hypothetical protein